MITSFSHIYLPVGDMDASIRFYEGLGFKLFRRWSAAPGRDAAYVRLGEVLLEMSLVQPENRATALTGGGKFGLTVSGGLDKQLDELRAKGVEVLPEGPPMRSFSGRQVRIKDPDGWEIALREWAPGDGPLNDNWTPKA